MFYYDFITARKQLNGDIIDFKYLTKIKEEIFPSYSKIHYELSHDKTSMKVIHCPEFNKLSLACSLPYFLFGHNYSISLKQEKDIIEFTSNVLNTNVFKFEVLDVESSVVLESPYEFKKILHSHEKIQGMLTLPFPNGKYFKDSNLTHKIYDFQKNLKSKVDKEIRKELELITDYSSEKVYVKIENKYTRPEIAIKQRGLIVENLFESKFIEIFKQDLLRVYESIKKSESIKIQNKKQLSSPIIYLLALKQQEEIGGFNTKSLIKDIIKSFDHVLTKEDQKARKRNLSNYLKTIEIEKCKYDIYDELKNALK